MPSAFDQPLAGFWRRALGFVIDDLILLLIGWATLGAAHVAFSTDVIGVAILAFLYNSLFIGFANGQTPGMRIVFVRCVDENDFTRINYARAARRSAFYTALLLCGSFHHLYRYVNPTTAELHRELHAELIFFVFYLPHIIDLLWVAWDKRKQTVHDKFAHTVVIRTR
jgi:uncharacterized RDD family membrane protein YckC